VSGLASFLPVQVEKYDATCQGKTLLPRSPGKCCEITCHGELYKRRAKKETSSASAGSPCDFVSHAGFVRVQQNLIDKNKLKA